MGKGTEVTLTEHRYCDFHKAAGKFVIATYDAKSHPLSIGRGSWAYMCDEDFDRHTMGKLGTGVGQKLIYNVKPNVG